MKKFIFLMILSLIFNFSYPQSQTQQTTTQLLGKDGTKTTTQTPTTTKPTAAKTPQPTPKPGQKTTKAATSKSTKKTTSKTTKSKSTIKSTRKKPQASKAKSTFTPFTMQADYDLPILYFTPSDITVLKGETFTTNIFLINPPSKPFDEIMLNIKYNPQFFECIGIGEKSWIFTVPLKENLITKIYQQKGHVIINAKLKEPITTNEQKILSLQWKAIELCTFMEIEFDTASEPKTVISHTGLDILGSPAKNDDGIFGAGVQILKEKTLEIIEGEEEDIELESEEIESADIIFDNMPLPDDIKYNNLKLFLSAPKEPVKVGKVFPVDIYLSNPEKVLIDQIEIVVHFDPEVLSVEDNDIENWITLGTNIFDGDYHETFPFDYHLDNNADNKKGIITYKVGISNPDMLPKKGKFATIFFKPLKENSNSKIFFKTSTSKNEPGTALRYMGRNILLFAPEVAEGNDFSGNLKNTNVKITQ